MQVLGDIVESIAGAILIDAKLDLDVVWSVFRPLLSPIVTPVNLELPPFRELLEWCGKNGYFLKTNFTIGEKIVATLDVQLKEKRLVRRSCGKSKKDAKADAASKLLKDLEVSFFCFAIFTTVCYPLMFNFLLQEELRIPKNASRTQQLQKQAGTAFLLQEGLQISKNTTRTQQLQKQGGTANHCNKLFDAMDTQPPTPTIGKKSDGSKIAAASLDKPGMFSVLSSFVSFVLPSTSSWFMSGPHIWTSTIYQLKVTVYAILPTQCTCR
jgi:endoribonuclease Dicer